MGAPRPDDNVDLVMDIRVALSDGLARKKWGVGEKTDGTFVVMDRDTGAEHAVVTITPTEQMHPDQGTIPGM